MAVNGGAGNEISFSDLQTFYGGSNPISLSEYYRGGVRFPRRHSAEPRAEALRSNNPPSLLRMKIQQRASPAVSHRFEGTPGP